MEKNILSRITKFLNTKTLIVHEYNNFLGTKNIYVAVNDFFLKQNQFYRKNYISLKSCQKQKNLFKRYFLLNNKVQLQAKISNNVYLNVINHVFGGFCHYMRHNSKHRLLF